MDDRNLMIKGQEGDVTAGRLNNMLLKAKMFLGEKDFDEVLNITARITDENIQIAEAWWLVFLAKNEIANENEFEKLSVDLSEDVNYKRALKFATPNEKNKYTSLINTAKNNREKNIIAEEKAAEKIRIKKEEELLSKYFVIKNGVLRKYTGRMPNVLIPSCVTEISNQVFKGRKSIKSVILQDGVTSIGFDAFSRCENLESVVLPKSVTSIWWGAFSRCKSLQSIVIQDGVTSIGGSAFEGCEKLQSVDIPESITSIEWGAFSGCKSLQSIVIPDGVTSIERLAFSGCENLQSIDIPESVTSIEWGAFSGCKSLQSIVIPDGVTSIERLAFSGCENLQSIELLNDAVDLGGGVFNGCIHLKTIKGSSRYIMEEGVLYDEEKKGLISCLGDGKTDKFYIKNVVQCIGDYAFSGCESLQSIAIPESVTNISSSAFSGCESLQSIAIPESVTNISSSAFSGCKSLQSVVIPESVTNIGSSAFSWCESLQRIAIPESVTSIGNGVFYWCYRLQDVELPNSITSIGDEAFRGCKKLKIILIPENVKEIGKRVFSNCDALTTIVAKCEHKLFTKVVLGDKKVEIVHNEVETFFEVAKRAEIALKEADNVFANNEKEKNRQVKESEIANIISKWDDGYYDSWDAVQERKNSGACRHCGGRFKGILLSVCVDCGRPKDY